MNLKDGIRLLTVPKYFKGGNDKQRQHLNEIIDFLSQLVANAQISDEGIPKTLRIKALANGQVTEVIFNAYLPVQPA